jgi:hypothetical protein
MAAAARLGPEVLSGLRVGLAQPLVNPAERARQTLGRDRSSFPGSHLLAQAEIQRRKRGNAKPATDLAKALIAGRKESGSVLLREVYDNRVGQVDPEAVSQAQGRQRGSLIDFK